MGIKESGYTDEVSLDIPSAPCGTTYSYAWLHANYVLHLYIYIAACSGAHALRPQ